MPPSPAPSSLTRLATLARDPRRAAGAVRRRARELRLDPAQRDQARRRRARARRQAERSAAFRAMDLTAIARRFRTDKWGVHFYTPHYQRHLDHLRDERFTLLEIGVGGYAASGKGGASLRMWRWFFQRARIVGLDIEDKSFVDRGPITTVRGDQTDETVLRGIVEAHGAPRVVIDDGSHVPAHVRATFAALFPLLPEGAVYCIEDTQTSYWPDWGGELDPRARGTSMDLVKDLVDGLNHEEFLDEDYRPSYTDQWVRAVHCYHNLVVIEKGENREGSNKAGAATDFRGDAPT